MAKDRARNPRRVIKVAGQTHEVYKKDGDVYVTHPNEKDGDWKTIDLTKHGRAHTIAEGVESVKDWHMNNG